MNRSRHDLWRTTRRWKGPEALLTSSTTTGSTLITAQRKTFEQPSPAMSSSVSLRCVSIHALLVHLQRKPFSLDCSFRRSFPAHCYSIQLQEERHFISFLFLTSSSCSSVSSVSCQKCIQLHCFLVAHLLVSATQILLQQQQQLLHLLLLLFFIRFRFRFFFAQVTRVRRRVPSS